MKFLKLTGADGKLEHINFDYVVRYGNRNMGDGTNGTGIIVERSEVYGLAVKESVEEITEMLKK